MSKLSPEQLAQEWVTLLQRFSPQTLSEIERLAQQHREELASYFYAQMLTDAAASQYLSHEQVKQRLNPSMQRWIVGLFSAHDAESVLPMIAQQVRIGEVHARIDVPMHLVLRGARALKTRLGQLVREGSTLGDDHASSVTRLAFDLIDMAMEVMSQAYASSHDRNARAEEAYRLFSVAQNVGAEREKQRAALLDWENQLMFEQAVGLPGAQLPRLGASEFGLWFRHKGAHAFQGTSETQRILETIDTIDDVVLPMFFLSDAQDHSTRVQRLRDLREQTRSIAFHLESLFEQNNELESGRDVLTRLLNRKFLPVVMGKEVALARKRNASFAVLALDIDHFKQVNDSHGHEAGDMVLQQLAAMLSNSSRAGDYIFRLGGEEFLLLLVDQTLASATRIAEKLRKQVEQESFRLPRNQCLQMSLSIGLAMHNGHPDYQHTLRQADEALYRAKHQGRNCVVVAQEG